MSHILLSLLGLALLVAGGEALVRGASDLARRWGVSPLWIGLTVVAFGTSTPELVVSVLSGVRGQGAIALGNVVGSNLANATLILGAAALLRPVRVRGSVVRREIPLLILVSVVVSLLLLDHGLGRVEGALLLGALVVWILSSRQSAPVESSDSDSALGADTRATPKALLLVGIGLVLLVAGAEALVRGATALARDWGVSETVIGLSVVAVGTSLPELATSLVAARRGEGDVAVGNVVGSNLFNSLGILGVSASVKPLHDPGLDVIDLGAMTLATLALLPLARSGHLVDRREGGLLLASYSAYMIWRFTG